MTTHTSLTMDLALQFLGCSMRLMNWAVAREYFPAATLTRWPQFDALRDDPAFQALLAETEAGRERARTAFREAGGERLLAR